MQSRLRVDAFEAPVGHDLATFTRRRTGELLSVLNTDADQLEEFLDADGLYANLWRVQLGELDALTPAFLDRARRLLAEVPSDGSDRTT